jgi:hypothetical protein
MPVHPSTRRRLVACVLVLSALAGLVCAGLSTGTLSLLPPKLKSSDLRVAAARTQILVDTPAPSIVQRRAADEDIQALVKRAEVFGRTMVSRPVLERIAKRAGVSPDSVGGSARITASVPLAFSEPGSEQRAADIRLSQLPYRIEVQAREAAPIIDVYSEAPDLDEAERLGDAAAPALRDYLRSAAADRGLPEESVATLRQLGLPRGGTINPGASLATGVLAFLVGFFLTCGVLVLIVVWLRPDYLRSLASRLASPRDEPEGDDWPNTTRVLPWMLAGFLAILWLVPFNSIELAASLPIDLKLDRLVLPFVAVAWILALLAGQRAAPRIRLTWIHAATALFMTCAFLSVILDAGYLNRTLELDLAFKKLPLLVAYVSLFVIAASALRRSEVPAFLTYTLILAVICAGGIIFEYRFDTNPFYTLSAKIFTGGFVVGEAGTGELDSIGRQGVHGPAEVPLEAVAMLAMALPIALVRLMQSDRWRGRILYGLAACALVAATFATYRKSALLAPVSVVLTLAYFRRRELLKLAPLGMVLAVLVSVLSPGAVSSTVDQFFRSDRLDVPTVSDRASDYDAVRPDVWSNLAFGRGWGTYNHESYRILDSEILHEAIELGVFGLIAFVLMGLSIPLAARKTIAGRDPVLAPVALGGAATAVAFLTVAALFDVLSFPHATYIFLFTAGVVSVVIAPRREEEEEAAPVARPAEHEEGRVHRGFRGRRLSVPPVGRTR